VQQIREIMHRDVKIIPPSASVRQAADEMRALDVGAVPVCDQKKLIGMITDRDIAIRSVAAGKDPETTKVAEVMTGEVISCSEDASVDEVARLMGDRQIRRIPVVDRNKALVGIVALADLAISPQHTDTKAEALEGVSEKRT